MKLLRTLIILAGSLLALSACHHQVTSAEPLGLDTIPDLKDSMPLQTAVGRDTIKITAVGDIMPGTAFPVGNLPPDDGATSFKRVQQYLTGDIIFGNLEGCMADSGTSTKCKDTSGNKCFAFRMPEHYISYFKNAGFNLFSLANNHVNDFGKNGRKRTRELLDSAGIHAGGLEEKPYAIFSTGNLTYGFLAFSPNDHTLSINDIPAAQEMVRALKKKVDIVIVSFHGGGEGARFEHVTRQEEIFFDEKRGNVYAFAHAMIDAGADLLLGNGPHVTRAVEIYKHKLIAYSLGNFCTYGMFNLKGPNGFAPLLQINLHSNGDLISAKVISVYQDKYKGLFPDPENNAWQRMKALTEEDFSEDPSVLFTDNHTIFPLNK